MGCEKTAMLTLYRRHSEKCPVQKLKLTSAAKRKYMDCDCPLWIYGNTETTVVPVNSDQLDKLGVVAHQSFVFWTRSNGRFGLRGRLVSDPCRPPVGDPRLAPSDRRPPALRKMPQADRRGPLFRFVRENCG